MLHEFFYSYSTYNYGYITNVYGQFLYIKIVCLSHELLNILLEIIPLPISKKLLRKRVIQG